MGGFRPPTAPITLSPFRPTATTAITSRKFGIQNITEANFPHLDPISKPVATNVNDAIQSVVESPIANSCGLASKCSSLLPISFTPNQLHYGTSIPNSAMSFIPRSPQIAPTLAGHRINTFRTHSDHLHGLPRPVTLTESPQMATECSFPITPRTFSESGCHINHNVNSSPAHRLASTSPSLFNPPISASTAIALSSALAYALRAASESIVTAVPVSTMTFTGILPTWHL